MAEMAVENGRISNFERLVLSCITHRPLPTCQISLKSKKILWTNGRTDGRMYLLTYAQMDGHWDQLS